MNCKKCGPAASNVVEIAAKTTSRDAHGIVRCHRLECGHAWHVAKPTNGPADPQNLADAVPCTCSEIAAVNTLLATGRQYAALGESLDDETLREWLAQVLEVLDGIPAASGASSLVRTAATAGKSQTTTKTKKMTNLNTLLVRAIKEVS